MQILIQHFQCWCYSYPTSTCLTTKVTSVLTYFINIYVAKNSKNENCYPFVSVVTPRKLSEKEIEEATESLLNEAESFLK